jgi:hypothetical protein
MKTAIAIVVCLITPLTGVLLAQDVTPDIAQLKAQVSQQQRQIEELSRKLEEFTKALERLATAKGSEEPARSDARLSQAAARPLVASTTPMLPAVPASMAALAAPAVSAQERPAESSPLQLKIGDAYIIPVGFLDFTSVSRSHDGGSGIGTNFAGIPYGNVFQNKLSEFRLSMQNSRIGFRVDAMVKALT